MRNIDVVIHLAAVMDFYPNDVKGLYRVNVEGTTNLLNAFIAERQNHHSYPTRFIYISSTENILTILYLCSLHPPFVSYSS